MRLWSKYQINMTNGDPASLLTDCCHGLAIKMDEQGIRCFVLQVVQRHGESTEYKYEFECLLQSMLRDEASQLSMQARHDDIHF